MALTDELFKSIDTIVAARIADLHYDQTIECEIVNADLAEQGIYKVQYQAATFDVTSTITTYQVGDRVYVAIPQNDYTLDKIILNKKYINEASIIKSLPFASFAYDQNKNLLLVVKNKVVSIMTTGSTASNTIVYTHSYEPNTYLGGYTKFGIKFTLSADIANEVASGNYGLTISLTGYDQTERIYPANILLEDEQLTTWTYKIDTTDIIAANVYNTLGQCNLEKIFDVTNKVIQTIKVEVWQDGNFKAINGSTINNKTINFTNFLLYFGYDLKEFKNNLTKIVIYTLDGLAYSPEYLNKTIQARFLILTSGTNIFTESILNESEWEEFHWQNYSIINGFENKDDTDLTINNKVITLSSSRNLKTEIYRLTLIRNIDHKEIISNTITFLNAAYLANSSLLDIVTGLLIIESEDNNVYNIYGLDNYTTNLLITSQEHAFLLSFNSLSYDINLDGLLAGDIITWSIPTTNTMLEKPVFYTVGPNGVIDSIFTEDTTKLTYICQKTILESCPFFKIPYKIKEYYSPKNVNNTIKFTLLRGVEEYKADFELLFGTSGIQGSEYSIIPYLTLNGNKVPYILYNEDENDKYYQIEFDVYDYNNNIINKDNIESYTYYFPFSKNIKYYLKVGNSYTEINSSSFTDLGLFIKLENTNITSIIDYYASLQIEIKIGSKIIINFFPIPIATDASILSVNAPSVITYDITGKKPFFNKNKLTLLRDTETSYKWEINYYTNNGITTTAPEEQISAWPIIEGELMEMPAIFHEGLTQIKMTLACIINAGTPVQRIIWACPLLIITNKYTTRSENKENNPVKIGTDDLYIKNSMVGLIYDKETASNEFEKKISGTFMGTIGIKDNSSQDLFGLFGYNSGQRTFCLNKDGYVYIGAETSEDNFTTIIDATLESCLLNEPLISGPIRTINNENFNINDGKLILTPTGALLLAGSLNGTNATFSGTVTAPTFDGVATNAANATIADNYNTTTGNINERMELIKTAINTLADRLPGATVNLW